MDLHSTLLLCIALWSGPSQGLRCWNCHNTRSPRDCLRYGYSQQCSFRETVCQTEVRYALSWGANPIIRSSCKEALACNDNLVQNPRRGWSPTQCNDGKFNSVCRCCCVGDHCNSKDLLCAVKNATIASSTSVSTSKTASALFDTKTDIKSTDGGPPRDIPIAPGKLQGEPSCEVFPNVPEKGNISCSNGRFLASECVFSCDVGYELVGNSNTTCQQFVGRAMWSRKSPTCRKRRVCGAVQAPKNGDVKCSGWGEVGITHCTFRCDEGLHLSGSETTSCVATPLGPQWTEEFPLCAEKCEKIATPENGFVECFGSGGPDTICGFVCDTGFVLEGDTTVSCFLTPEGSRWSGNVPVCTAPLPRCPDLGELEHGRIFCDNSKLELGTTCRFRCSRQGNVPLRRKRFESVCEATPDGGVRWSRRKPCCNSFCSTQAKKDIVVIIDSSTSVKKREWKRMKDFILHLIRNFNISEDGVQISAFRFTKHVDRRSQILFGRHRTEEGLMGAVKKIPKRGGGSNIGNALRYAKNVVLKKRNRPEVSDLVFIMTDGQSKDEFLDIAKELRDSGVQIVALGVFRDNAHTLTGELAKMTGDRDLVMPVLNVLDNFQYDALRLIAERICEVTCD